MTHTEKKFQSKVGFYFKKSFFFFFGPAVEYCGKSRRTAPLLVMMSSYALGSLTIPFLTKILPSWHYLAAFATFPNLIVLLGYKWVPESPSWLLCKGKFEIARLMLNQVARINGKDVSVLLGPMFYYTLLTLLTLLVVCFRYN